MQLVDTPRCAARGLRGLEVASDGVESMHAGRWNGRLWDGFVGLAGCERARDEGEGRHGTIIIISVWAVPSGDRSQRPRLVSDSSLVVLDVLSFPLPLSTPS